MTINKVTGYRLQATGNKIILFSVCLSVFGFSGFSFAQNSQDENKPAQEVAREYIEGIDRKDTVASDMAKPIEPDKPEDVRQEEKTSEKESAVVSGDKLEYPMEENTVVIEGHAVVIYKKTKLIADKITYNTKTFDARAEGGVRLEFDKGVMKGERLVYNFTNKTGYIEKAKLFAYPFYLTGPIVDRVDENEFGIKRGYFSTCDLDHPHWRIKSQKIEMYPGDRITAKKSIIYAGDFPIFYLPTFTHNLKDALMRVQVEPGFSKDWGAYLLTAWRYYISESFMGRIHIDAREKRDLAFGIDGKYTTRDYGKGIIRTYYMNERTNSRDRFYEKWTDPELGGSTERDRYRVQLRHKWVIDETSDFVTEYNRMSDVNFLKDYFYRQEYERDNNEETYVQYTKSFLASTFSFYAKKRVNRFESVTEKLPELKTDTPAFKLFDGPIYLKDSTSFVNYHSTTAHSDIDNEVFRADTYNELSLPFKLSFLELNPYAGARETYFSKGIDDESLDPRTVFYNGISMNTRFYRLFDVSSNFAGIEINKLRHIISPLIEYRYNHKPTIQKEKLFQFDEIDSIDKSKKINLSLENKLQTKRNDESIDFARLLLTSSYDLGIHKKRFLSDIVADFEVLPYDWMNFKTGAVYDPREKWFKSVDLDLSAKPFDRWSATFGHRYERKGTKELTTDFAYRLNPLWRFRVFERFQFATGELKEQEYTISRDLHCWWVDFTYNSTKVKGDSIWVVFRLKAFPESELGWEKEYNSPKAGSQSALPRFE